MKVSMRKTRLSSAPSVGPYEWLRPRNPDGTLVAIAAGMYFNSYTGEIEGSTVSDQRPIFVNTVALTDSGVATTNMDNLNAAIATAASSSIGNTVITMPTGFVADGQVTLKTNTADYWIGLEWANAQASLPTPSPQTANLKGTYLNRLPTAAIPSLPVLYCSTALSNIESPVMVSEAGAGKYYIRGLNITNPTQVFKYFMCYIVPSDATNTSTYPHDIHFVQCANDGGDNVRRWIFFAGIRVSVTDCYSVNCGTDGSDPQNILYGYGPGPLKIHNNYLHCGGASENILIGGTGTPGVDATYVPKDGQITQNYFTKPVTRTPRPNANPSYNSNGNNNHKNFEENKSGIRFVIQGNRGGYHNSGGQQNCIVMKTSEQDGANPYCITKDIIIMHNYCPEGPSGLVITGTDQASPPTLETTKRIFAANNLFVSRNSFNYTFADLTISTAPLDNINVIYSTHVQYQSRGYGGAFGISGVGAATNPNNVVVNYNVLIPCMLIGESGPPLIPDGNVPGYSGDAVFAFLVTGSSKSFVGNLTFDQYHPEYYPAQHCVAIEADLGLNNISAGEYWLTSSSPGYHAAPGGRDVGYQKPLLDAIQARVLP